MANYVSLAIVIIGFTLIGILLFSEGVALNEINSIGLFLMIIGLIFFTMARIQLGRSFQATAAANHLVTTGIYKKIRHPVYVFGFILILGLIIFIQKLYLLPLLIVLIFIQIKRIRKEEKVLEEKFGDAYREYRKKTWF